MIIEDKDKICSQCGHKYSSHEATEEGIGNCEMIMEEDKAIFQCVCRGEE